MLQRGDSDIGWADLYIIPDRARLPLLKQHRKNYECCPCHSDCQSLTQNVMILCLNLSRVFVSTTALQWSEDAKIKTSLTDWLIDWLTRSPTDLDSQKESNVLYRDKDIIIWFLLLRIIDYTDPYDIEYACFMLSKPPPLPQWQAFVTPLQPPVFFKLF